LAAVPGWICQTRLTRQYDDKDCLATRGRVIPDKEKSIAATYRRFAETEAHGRSPLYEELASGVAADPNKRVTAFPLPDDLAKVS
jgi:hypothetical protein